MASKLIEICGTYLSEFNRFANPDGDVVLCKVYVNSDINAPVTFKGPADIDELTPDLSYRFYGRWTSYENRRTGQAEKQFAFQSFVREQPHSREGVIAYLVAAGKGLGFGQSRARKLWELLGSDAVRTLRESPDEVADKLTAAGLNLSREKAELVAESLREDAALEGCTLDLMDLLTGRGFPKSTARNAVRAWGNHAANIIRRNPYRLMAFKQCGFKKTDALYLHLKHDPYAIRRQGYCLWYTIARDTEGHTWHGQQFVDRAVRGMIPGSQVKFEHAAKFARRLGATREAYTTSASGPLSLPAPHGNGRVRWFAEARKAEHEADIAEAVSLLGQSPIAWPDVSQLGMIDDHQRTELAKSLGGAVGILGGSPGTGKTYTIAALVQELIKVAGEENVLIGAPTGKAAVRVSENLSRCGIPIRARTWHSSLSLLERFKLKHFTQRFVIGDESSMNDTDIMAAVFRAIPLGTHVLLVGDVNQLPPVGHGAPLRDLIAAGLPYGELREIKRNSGGIVEACAAIRDSRRWQPGDNLILDECNSPEGQIEAMLQAIREAKQAGLDPIWDVQPLVPTNGKMKSGEVTGSPLSRKKLNKLLQQELNPNGGIDSQAFRVGDKIVNTKNGKFPAYVEPSQGDEAEVDERGEIYVANGELAEVLEVSPSLIIAKLSNPTRTIKIPRAKESDKETDPQADGQDGSEESTGTGCSWDLGYCLSTHKAQGSDWPVAIILLDAYPGAKMVCSREWLYTAISRAKDECVLIGQRHVADEMVKRIALSKRKTLLKEQVLLQKAQLILADM